MKATFTILIVLILAQFGFSQSMIVNKNDGSKASFPLTEIKNITFEESDGLVAYYPLNENTNDISGNNHHGTLNGAVLLSNGGVQLVGKNTVDFPNDPFILPNGRWELVINLNEITNNDDYIVCKNNYNNNDDGVLSLGSDGKPYFLIKATNPQKQYMITSSISISTNIDTKIVAQWGTNGMKLYINDVLVASNDYTGGIVSASRPLQLGGSLGMAHSINGTVKYFKVYSN